MEVGGGLEGCVGGFYRRRAALQRRQHPRFFFSSAPRPGGTHSHIGWWFTRVTTVIKEKCWRKGKSVRRKKNSILLARRRAQRGRGPPIAPEVEMEHKQRGEHRLCTRAHTRSLALHNRCRKGGSLAKQRRFLLLVRPAAKRGALGCAMPRARARF